MVYLAKDASVAFALSIIAHHGFLIHGEWHLQAPTILACHILIFPAIFSLDILTGHTSVHDACTHSLFVGTVYLTALILSIVTYRLYFHRLRGFPGPRLAALSKIWHVWRCRDSRGHLVLDDWHHRYGTFVRTGPSEVTIFHAGAFEAMDGPGNQNQRSDWYDLLYPRISSIFTREKKVHEARRKTWDHALSSQALAQYFERINNHVHELDHAISEQILSEIVVNDLMYWFAFDSMGDFGFNESFGMLKQREWLDAALNLRSAIALLGPFSPAIWIPRIAFAFIPGVWRVRHWFQMLDFADNCMNNRMNKASDIVDIASSFIKDYESRGRSSIGQQLLSGDTATMVVAGSDTTAPSLIILLFFLAAYPDHAEIIRGELAGVDVSNVKALSVLPHLNATINESMRLFPAILTFSSRVTPSQGLIVEGTFIPGNTKICAPRYTISRLDSAYEHPTDFIPERWYSRPELIKDRRAFSPFGLGRTSCVGKQLALGQLRLVAARLLTKYRFRFATDEARLNFEEDMRDQLTANPGRLVLVFEHL